MPAMDKENIGPVDNHSLQCRVRAEFREMPGLKLTLPQAARLFGLDARRCEQVLDLLVATGELASGGGLFMRGGAGCAR